jgi:hypothetical protein
VFILEILYTTILFLAFRYWHFLQIKNMPLWIMPSAFLIKIGVGILFLTMYLHPDTNNSVPSDTMRFLGESKNLRHVFTVSIKDYFSLLFGFGDDEYLIKKYLQDTFLWDAGSVTIVNDSRNIIRLHSVIQFISLGSPYIHSLFMCLIALIGLKQLYVAFQPYSKVKPLFFFFVILLFPSILFWTSGILKEPILLLGIGLCSRTLLSSDIKQKRIIYGVGGAILLFSIKPYILASIIPAILFYVIYKYTFKEKILISLISLAIMLGSIILILKPIRVMTVDFLSRKQYDFDHIGKGGLFIKGDTSQFYFYPSQFDKLDIDIKHKLVQIKKPTTCLIVSRKNTYSPVKRKIYPENKKRKLKYYVGGANSYIKTTMINRSFIQLIKNSPEALINSYFRPFPFDPGSNLKYPAMFEVWLLTFMLLFSFFKRRKLENDTKAIVISLLVFSTFLLLIIGWTTPVIGAIFRYRFPAILALTLISLIIFKPIEIKSK